MAEVRDGLRLLVRTPGSAPSRSSGPVLDLLMPLTAPGAGVLLFVTGGFCVTAGVVGGNVIKAGFQQWYCPPDLLGRLTAGAAFLDLGAIPV